ACDLLEKGGLVVFPTETVYGIAANLLNAASIERLAKVKSRPENKQFSVHVADKDEIEKYAVDILPRAYKMIDMFWPGPLTLVLKAPGGKSVGLRMPKNEIARRLIRNCDFPIVAPSANLAGKTPPSSIESAVRDLNGLVDLILDCGPTELGAESTVLDARDLPFAVLREGYLKKDDVLSATARKQVLFVCTGNSCRSVMAEYILKKILQDKGRDDVDVVSAGTMAFGMAPTRETLKLIDELGLDASDHRARHINTDLLRTSDLVLVMENKHRSDVVHLFPSAASRVHVLGEMAGYANSDREIADPIGRSEEFYKMTFEKIKAAIERLDI
ncbi:MAG TPA: L-threonylcarbamoyladenylate synthase, partial [Candidatus Omnitrophota bacterium]|nr:L-threonylcarbamoyladenylate synthase [Candidatus Omnitrophota bacterium]